MPPGKRQFLVIFIILDYIAWAIKRSKGTTVMRAAMYYNNRDIRIEEVATPTIGEGELLIKVGSSGICYLLNKSEKLEMVC